MMWLLHFLLTGIAVAGLAVCLYLMFFGLGQNRRPLLDSHGTIVYSR